MKYPLIREAVEEDIEEICNLELELFPDNALSVAQLERELTVSKCFVLGDPVYAYALVGRDGDLLDLLRLGVWGAARGRGEGTRLLQHVLSLGQAVMLTVRKDNHGALRLYRRNGFEIVGSFTSARAWALYRPEA